MGALEDDVVIGAAGEEGPKTPGNAVKNADFPEVVNGLHLLGKSPANGGPEHGFEIHVKARLGCVEGFFEGGFNDGQQGFDQFGVIQLAFDFLESGKGFLNLGVG